MHALVSDSGLAARISALETNSVANLLTRLTAAEDKASQNMMDITDLRTELENDYVTTAVYNAFTPTVLTLTLFDPFCKALETVGNLPETSRNRNDLRDTVNCIINGLDGAGECPDVPTV